MKRWLLSALLTLLGSLAQGQPMPNPDQPGQLKIEGNTKADPYRLVRLEAKGAGPKDAVRWRVSPSKGVDRANTARGVLEFVAPPGVYEIELETIAVGADGSLSFNTAFATVTIGTPAPVPPGPGPTPPSPNPPGPNPPAPTDPLGIELAALYASDATATKVPDLMLLAELYRQAAELAKDPATVTLGGLSTRVALAGSSLLPTSRLANLRRRIAEFLKVEFGEVDLPMTPELRAKTSGAYTRIHLLLKQIGGMP